MRKQVERPPSAKTPPLGRSRPSSVTHRVEGDLGFVKGYQVIAASATPPQAVISISHHGVDSNQEQNEAGDVLPPPRPSMLPREQLTSNLVEYPMESSASPNSRLQSATRLELQNKTGIPEQNSGPYISGQQSSKWNAWIYPKALSRAKYYALDRA